MFVSVLAIWKRPPIERSIWIDSRASAIAVLVAALHEHRVGERVLRARLHAPRAALPEDGDGVDVRVDGLAHAPDAAQEHAARSQDLAVQARRHVAAGRRVERREGAVARGERPLHVAELAEQVR